MSEDKKTVLIVEDDLLLSKALSDKFSDEGFVVLLAKDGQEGLDMALSKLPNVILLDILMPNKDGIEMMHQLRGKNAWGKSVPIVMLTNLPASDKIMDKVTEDKASFYLVKSNSSLDEIVDKVKQVFE